jgi:hypothetical protein
LKLAHLLSRRPTGYAEAQLTLVLHGPTSFLAGGRRMRHSGLPCLRLGGACTRLGDGRSDLRAAGAGCE